VVEDAAIGQVDGDLLDRAWGPRVLGGWHLFHAVAEHPLDWWLTLSSAASLIGDAGQAAYAAADGWLDAFTAYGRGHGVPVQGINWGVRVGDAAGRRTTPITPAEAVEAIDLVLRHDRAQTGLLPNGDSRLFIGDRGRTTPFFAGLARGDSLETLRIDLLAADPGTRHTRITEYIVDQSSAILRCDRAALDPDSPLTDCGLDSLTALELRTGIERGLGIRIPAKAIWEHGTPAALAAHLADRL
jgi:acyl carrier protein